MACYYNLSRRLNKLYIVKLCVPKEKPLSICRKYTNKVLKNDSHADDNSPLEVLKKKIANNELIHDDYQIKIVESLQRVYDDLKGYKPSKASSFLSKWLKSSNANKPPKGLYIYGAVGGGKTMLMDLFYNCCQVNTFLFF